MDFIAADGTVYASAASLTQLVRECARPCFKGSITLRINKYTAGLTAESVAGLAAEVVRANRKNVTLHLQLDDVPDAERILHALLPAMVMVKRLLLIFGACVRSESRRALLVKIQSRAMQALVISATDMDLSCFEQLYLSMHRMPSLTHLSIRGSMSEDQALALAGGVRSHRTLRVITLYKATEAFGVHIMAQACAMSARGADRTLVLIRCSTSAIAMVPTALFNRCMSPKRGDFIPIGVLGTTAYPDMLNTGLGTIAMYSCKVDDHTLGLIGLALSMDTVLHTVRLGCLDTSTFTQKGIAHLSEGASMSTAIRTLCINGCVGEAGVAAVAKAVERNAEVRVTLVDAAMPPHVHSTVMAGCSPLHGGSLVINGVVYV